MAMDLDPDPDRIAEYEAHHRAVWPEVVAGLRGIGIRQMRIYRCGSRLFMTCEVPVGFDPVRDYQTYADDPRCREWDALMRTYQRQVPSADPEAWWTPMDPVFELPLR